MIIESERLRLYPVDDAEMARLIACEKVPEMKQAYAEMRQGCLNDPENRVWYAPWYMELRDEPGTVAGDFCFKGPANEGAVEIGYGLRDGFTGRGYMTETVRAACAWALRQPGVVRVEAETEPANIASQRVLSRAGFLPTGTQGEEGPRFALIK